MTPGEEEEGAYLRHRIKDILRDLKNILLTKIRTVKILLSVISCEQS